MGNPFGFMEYERQDAPAFSQTSIIIVKFDTLANSQSISALKLYNSKNCKCGNILAQI